MTTPQTLPVIFQGHDWLIINKPAGVSVHNDIGDVRTLLKKQLPEGSFEDIYPIHRLDKETSGLLLLATNSKMAATLAEQFQNHKTEKIYFAVLRGALPVSDQWLEWATPLSDKAEGRRNPQGMARDRIEAKTRYRVVKANKYFSLIEVQLLTGRQHQIRKHAVLAKHQIIGDTRYGDPKYNTRIAEMYKTNRMYLHAAKLSLEIGGKLHTFEAPLPLDFDIVKDS